MLLKRCFSGIEISDALIFAGLCFCAYGIWEFYRPATAVFIGVVLIKLGMVGGDSNG